MALPTRGWARRRRLGRRCHRRLQCRGLGCALFVLRTLFQRPPLFSTSAFVALRRVRVGGPRPLARIRRAVDRGFSCIRGILGLLCLFIHGDRHDRRVFCRVVVASGVARGAGRWIVWGFVCSFGVIGLGDILQRLVHSFPTALVLTRGRHARWLRHAFVVVLLVCVGHVYHWLGRLRSGLGYVKDTFAFEFGQLLQAL